jgi:hypothetical protein
MPVINKKKSKTEVQKIMDKVNEVMRKYAKQYVGKQYKTPKRIIDNIWGIKDANIK